MRGVHSLDAPVSGGDVGAREARLSIMIGGDSDGGRGLAAPVGRRWARRSSVKVRPGAGQHTKLVNQMLIAVGMIGVCEARLYGYQAGLDLRRC